MVTTRNQKKQSEAKPRSNLAMANNVINRQKIELAAHERTIKALQTHANNLWEDLNTTRTHVAQLRQRNRELTEKFTDLSEVCKYKENGEWVYPHWTFIYSNGETLCNALHMEAMRLREEFRLLNQRRDECAVKPGDIVTE